MQVLSHLATCTGHKVEAESAPLLPNIIISGSRTEIAYYACFCLMWRGDPLCCCCYCFLLFVSSVARFFCTLHLVACHRSTRPIICRLSSILDSCFCGHRLDLFLCFVLFCNHLFFVGFHVILFLYSVRPEDELFSRPFVFAQLFKFVLRFSLPATLLSIICCLLSEMPLRLLLEMHVRMWFTVESALRLPEERESKSKSERVSA